MKNLFILFVLAISLSSSKPETKIDSYDLATAVSKGLINYTVLGNSDSPHYYQPLSININNLTDNNFEIKIPNGQTFSSVSKEHQDIIITKEEIIAINTGKTEIKVPLFGMCIQQDKSAPNIEESYQLGELAEGNILKLCREIEERTAFNTLGQYAIWTLTDENDLNKINGFDLEEATHLKTYVADLLGVPVPEYEEDEIYYTDVDPNIVNRTINGKFRYKFSKESAVTIGMFDDQDIIVKELYNNPNTPPGEHHLNYHFNKDVHTDEVYYIRLIINGQIKINFEMKARRS